MAGLDDRARSGRPPVYGPGVRLRIVATATSAAPHPYDGWSHRLIADHLADTGISASQVGRILAALQVKPHRVRGWLTRPTDPHFFTRVAEVCALYRNGPPRSVVLSVDEKTAMAARSRKHPDRPPALRRARLREFEYVRHGTVSVTAALDVHTGQVAYLQGHPGLAGETPTDRGALHAQARLLAEPGGDLLLPPGPRCPASR
ncbi:helix-turn-helix domain-containing protein [Streptomyces sp. NPDC058812]|uniref:helix-turn-helix domain-containing protein n=1 Tax=unclassified Streptomyces TaxID=2593676 RepID=UPI0036CF7D94